MSREIRESSTSGSQVFVIVNNFPIEQFALFPFVGNQYALEVTLWSVLIIIASLLEEGEKCFGRIHFLEGQDAAIYLFYELFLNDTQSYHYIDTVSVVEEGRLDVGELSCADKPLGQDIPSHHLEALFAGLATN